MKNTFYIACAAFAAGVWTVLADDAVGVMAVSAPGSAPVPFALPFEPFGDGRPGAFLSGPFVGDGDDARSDRLLHFFGHSVTGAVRSAAGWIAPGDGTLGSVLPAAPGDAFVLETAPSSGPFRFHVFGRVPSAATLADELLPGMNLVSFGYPYVVTTNDLPPGIAPVSSADPFSWCSALWISNAAPDAVSWVRGRPYGIPSAGAPAVTGLSVAPDGSAAELSVDSAGRRMSSASSRPTVSTRRAGPISRACRRRPDSPGGIRSSPQGSRGSAPSSTWSRTPRATAIRTASPTSSKGASTALPRFSRTPTATASRTGLRSPGATIRLPPTGALPFPGRRASSRRLSVRAIWAVRTAGPSRTTRRPTSRRALSARGARRFASACRKTRARASRTGFRRPPTSCGWTLAFCRTIPPDLTRTPPGVRSP